MWQENALAGAKRLITVELEDGTGSKLNATGVEVPDTELRALQVGEDADGVAVACRASPHGVVERLCTVMSGMAEVNAENVDAGDKKTLDHFRGS
jgi:hypothetical protein